MHRFQPDLNCTKFSRFPACDCFLFQMKFHYISLLFINEITFNSFFILLDAAFLMFSPCNSPVIPDTPFRHYRYIDSREAPDPSFAQDGSRTVRLVISGHVVNVHECVRTNHIGSGEFLMSRAHTLTVETPYYDIFRADVISGLREYDEQNSERSRVNRYQPPPLPPVPPLHRSP